ncbi:MAG: adenine deaminase [Deltaproteobacteria bacterium]|nr:adenine deaminase [Deltaproteobacteria bacterium]
MTFTDYILRSARLVDVKRREIRRAEIRVSNGRFVSVEEAGKTVAKGIKAIDCSAVFVSPGLIDGHTHTELSLMSMAPFAQMLLRSGTTAAIIDPHDFVNVVGMRGLKLLQKEAVKTPLRAFFMAPCCVPSAAGLEDSGVRLTYADVAGALSSERVLGLAEVMDTARLLRRDRALLKMIKTAGKLNKVVDGHCPALSLQDESRYLRISRAKTEHESVSIAEILRKHRRGLWVHLRRSSFGREYPYAEVFRKTKGERLMLSTDGCVSPVDVMREGHISAFVRELIAAGVRPVDAVCAATINPALCYGLDREIGSIEAGKRADFILMKDLNGFAPYKTFINGKDVTKTKAARMTFPVYALNTVKAKSPDLDALRIQLPRNMRALSRVTVNVIGLRDGSLITEKKRAQMKNSNGVVNADPKRDILKAVVLERFSNAGRPQAGFVKGFGLKSGAFGGSIGQDCQHICVIGCDDKDIITVIDRVIREQGGIFYAKDGRMLDGLRLPLGGIMTNRPATEVAKRLERLEALLRRSGVKVASPYLTLSLQITLAAIPALKLTNRGLLDAGSGAFIDVVRSR